MPNSYIQIGGQTIDSANVAGPIPSKSFRDAWKLDGDVISVDMAKAKAIAKEYVREEAAPVLARLREVIEERQDNGLAVTNQIAKRKALRAALADPRIDAATTPEELLAVLKTIREEVKAA